MNELRPNYDTRTVVCAALRRPGPQPRVLWLPEATEGGSSGTRDGHVRSPPRSVPPSLLGPTSPVRGAPGTRQVDVKRRRLSKPRRPLHPCGSGLRAPPGTERRPEAAGAAQRGGRLARGLPRRPALWAAAKPNLLCTHIGVLSTQDIWFHKKFQSAHNISSLLRRTKTGTRVNGRKRLTQEMPPGRSFSG